MRNILWVHQSKSFLCQCNINIGLIDINATIGTNSSENLTIVANSTMNITEIKKTISICAFNYSTDIDKMSQCITQASIAQHSLELLGCNVQCSISSWRDGLLYLHCVEGCLNESQVVIPRDPIRAYSIQHAPMTGVEKALNLLFCSFAIAGVLLVTLWLIKGKSNLRANKKKASWNRIPSFTRRLLSNI